MFFEFHRRLGLEALWKIDAGGESVAGAGPRNRCVRARCPLSVKRPFCPDALSYFVRYETRQRYTILDIYIYAHALKRIQVRVTKPPWCAAHVTVARTTGVWRRERSTRGGLRRSVGTGTTPCVRNLNTRYFPEFLDVRVTGSGKSR